MKKCCINNISYMQSIKKLNNQLKHMKGSIEYIIKFKKEAN